MILLTGSGDLANCFSKLLPCKIISARLLNTETLTREIEKASVVIHNAAAINSVSLSSYIEANFILTKRILDIASLVNPQVKFIYISSMSILSDTFSYKDVEDMTEYAFSKYLGEIYCLKHKLENLFCVRFSTIFYENPTKDGLSKLAYEAIKMKRLTVYNDGVALRDFIPISIAVKYLYQLAIGQYRNKKINIVSGRPLSFKHFSNIILANDNSVKYENIKGVNTNVLYDFDKTGVEEIGEIEFKIENFFIKYMKNLDENNSI